MSFSKFEYNNIDWSPSQTGSDLTLGDIPGGNNYAVTILADPNVKPGGPWTLFLPPTQSSDRWDRQEYPFRLTIYDPLEFLNPGSSNYSGGLRIKTATGDTGPVPTINGTAGSTGVAISTTTGKQDNKRVHI